ncbi:MAG TPA: 1,4-alpha-glucan branching enzyme, partial [Paracoccaceae bacterium]|nr:1,4-alpha-glucan branching enzyme [Paracoccaceae bacterium]
MTLIEPSVARDIVSGNFDDPFSVLGLHDFDGKLVLRVFAPDAEAVEVLDSKTGRKICELNPVPDAGGLFTGLAGRRKKRFGYKLRMSKDGHRWTQKDPYNFGPVMGDIDEHLFNEGTHRQLWNILGAHIIKHEGSEGVHFAVWAPNARRVSVVGDFNGWDGRKHSMRRRGQTGIWEIFVPDLGEGEPYKYELQDRNGHLLPQKADPYGFGSEHPPKTASIVRRLDKTKWSDKGWMSKREAIQRFDKPITIYEVHLGSWK